MKIVGYCERCHKIKQVRVTARGLIGSVPVGICDQCAEQRR